MFDNVDWNKIINNILSYVAKDWEKLIIKIVVNQVSYTANYYYSKNNKFINIYDEPSLTDIDDFDEETQSEVEKIMEKFKDNKEKLFFTIKVEKKGNVKVIYRYVKDGDELPWDETSKYIVLNENDKVM